MNSWLYEFLICCIHLYTKLTEGKEFSFSSPLFCKRTPFTKSTHSKGKVPTLQHNIQGCFLNVLTLPFITLPHMPYASIMTNYLWFFQWIRNKILTYSFEINISAFLQWFPHPSAMSLSFSASWVVIIHINRPCLSHLLLSLDCVKIKYFSILQTLPQSFSSLGTEDSYASNQSLLSLQYYHMETR